jgi:hypothetical protein
MFAIAEVLYGVREGRKGKKNARASTILQNITPVKVEDLRIFIESC